MDFDTADAMLYNDLERVVRSRNRAIGRIIRRLALSLSRKIVVSGSGPSVFCLCPTRKEAVEARKKLLGSIPARERTGWGIYTVKTS